MAIDSISICRLPVMSASIRWHFNITVYPLSEYLENTINREAQTTSNRKETNQLKRHSLPPSPQQEHTSRSLCRHCEVPLPHSIQPTVQELCITRQLKEASAVDRPPDGRDACLPDWREKKNGNIAVALFSLTKSRQRESAWILLATTNEIKRKETYKAKEEDVDIGKSQKEEEQTPFGGTVDQ